MLAGAHKDVHSVVFACILHANAIRSRGAQGIGANYPHEFPTWYFSKCAIHARKQSELANEPAKTIEPSLANPAIHSWPKAGDDCCKLWQKRCAVSQFVVFRQPAVRP
jgi:hypothetical protein